MILFNLVTKSQISKLGKGGPSYLKTVDILQSAVMDIFWDSNMKL